MVRIGIYLPVYGGWLPSRESVRAELDGVFYEGENERPPAYEYVREVALEAERIGVDSLWIPDHMLNPIKGESAPALEAWTTAVAVAEATERVTIVHTTLCEAFRYPAVLAKQAATLAEISKGRFWLSIGAGWYRREYEAYGLPYFRHDERVEKARETIQIVRKLWTEDEVTFEGKYYSVNKGVLVPKPEPLPPIWYAGMSEASRDLVASVADGWLMRGLSLEDAKKYLHEMRDRLREKGREDIEYALPGLTFIRDTDDEAKELVWKLTGGKKAVLDRTLDTGLVGSPETVARKIRQFEEIGIDHVIMQLSPTLDELKNVRKVLDILKGRS